MAGAGWPGQHRNRRAADRLYRTARLGKGLRRSAMQFQNPALRGLDPD
jgi:hypothetical protein